MANYSTTVEPRYRDLDGMNHVNHAVFVTYLENARNEFFEKVLSMDMSSPDVVVVSVEVEYKGPINWGNDVAVDINVDEIGSRSFTLEYKIRTENGVAATAKTTQVTIDPEDGNSRPIPEQYKNAFDASA